MTKPASTAGAGLRDVVAAPSSICFIDGEQGILIYSGYNIHDLAEHSTFEEVVFLLWNGRLPKRDELDELDAQLKAQRALPAGIIAMIKAFPKGAVPMDALRTTISALAFYDPERSDNSLDANRRRALRLTAQFATVVAAIDRARNGKEPLDPKPELAHAANFLYMLNGTPPSEFQARALDVSLILYAEHEFNASTFTARVVCSTESDLHSSVVAAIGALKGRLHGGANEKVMDLLLQTGGPEKAERWITEALGRKDKIMGFGHRVYKTGDVRARVLREYARKAAQLAGQTRWEEAADIIEKVLEREKSLFPNLDWPAGRLYHALGLEPSLYTPFFVASRVAGWSAHIMEQAAHNRLIRPRARYTGPEERHVTPVNERP